MARTTWNIYIYSGGAWVADGTIYAPNDSLLTNLVSTQVKTRLADGSNAFMRPETKYVKEPTTFIWYYDDGTLKTKIEGYVQNNTKVKIVDSGDSTEHIGRFINIRVRKLVGQSPAKYDIEAEFEYEE